MYTKSEDPFQYLRYPAIDNALMDARMRGGLDIRIVVMTSPQGWKSLYLSPASREELIKDTMYHYTCHVAYRIKKLNK